MSLTAAAMFFALSAGTIVGGSDYTSKMFRRAICYACPCDIKPGREVVVVRSSSLYCLVTTQDPRTHQDREVAVLSNFLIGAIISEYRLSYGFEGLSRACQIALSSPGHIFHFKSWSARRNIPIYYTSQMLDSVRVGSGQITRRISAGRDGHEKFLTRFYMRDKPQGGFWTSDDWRDAVAHALLERGVLVGQGDAITPLSVDDGRD